MAASEITNLIGAVIQIASTIQETGNNSYRASAAWTEFPRKVAHLQRQLKFWDEKLIQYGLLSDASLVTTLSEAKKLLDEEQAKLSKRKAKHGARLWPQVSMTMFPAKIGLKLQQAIEGFDAILGQLEKEHAAEVALRNRMMDKAPTFTVRNDDRYVPLVRTESAVYSALEDKAVRAGPSIVLLYGLSGKGKSTLARHAVLRYQNPPNSTLFKRVVFLQCGPEADRSAKQFDLLQLLGPTTGGPEDQLEASRDAAICKRLKSLLKDEKILIILDDIWEKDLLKCVVHLCGAGVKCLVTSQRGDLCQGLGFFFTKVQIENISEEVAMEILASHVGFRNRLVPEHIKGVAQEMVQKTEGLPVALASIATAIGVTRSDELEEWKAASQNFLNLLHSEDTAYVHGEKYPRSCWSAMQLSVKSLTKDAKNLLILVHMCAGPSIPEEVLRILYLRVKFEGLHEPFEKTRNDLESRALIKITGVETQRSWSVHTLQKLFVEEEMRDLKESMFTRVALKTVESGVESSEVRVDSNINTEFPRDEDSMVQITLCALYFDDYFAHRASLKVDIPPNLFSLSRRQLLSIWRRNAIEPITRLLGWPASENWKSDAQSSTKQVISSIWRRNAIEPITRLLGRPVSENWKSDAQSSAKQIFMQYIHHNVLHYKGILHLLGVPISIIPMLSALEGVLTVDKIHLIDPNLRTCIAALVELLEDHGTGNSSIAEGAGRVILQLAEERLQLEILTSSGILEAIVRILSSEPYTDSQVTLSKIFLVLDDMATQIDCTKIMVETPGVPAVLVKSLFYAEKAALQLDAATARRNMATGEFAGHKIICFPGAIEQLINLLCNNTTPGIREWAGRVILQLAEERLHFEILTSSGILEAIVRILSSEPYTDSQVTLIKIFLVLGDMATQIDCTEIMVQTPGVPAVLVKSLFYAEKAALQLDAATARPNMASGEFAGHKIIRFPGAIEQLINLLCNSTTPGIREWAGDTLCSWGAMTEETMLMVINCPGALEQLGKMLSLENNATLHPDEFDHTLYAAKLLFNLAFVVSFMEPGHLKYAKQKLNETEGLMDGLLGLLAYQIPILIQVRAIGALTHLDPALGNGLCLHSGAAYSQRGFANLHLGLNKESLRDLYEANKIRRGPTSFTLICQVTAKVRLGDCQGALADANTAIEIDRGAFNLQERGVLKRMIGDLPGALADLDKGIDLEPDDYELLKQRGLVRFMMNDEEGARSDAEMALKVKPSWVDWPGYGRGSLGGTSVEFLDYKLK